MLTRLRHSPWLILGFVGVSGIFAASLVANFMAGWNFTGDPLLKPVFGGVSASVDALKAMMVFAVFGCLARWRQGPHKIVAALLSLAIFASCLAWSLRSAADFASAAFSNVLVERSAKGGNLRSMQTELEDLLNGQPGLLAITSNLNARRASRVEAAKAHEANTQRISDLREAISKAVGKGEAIDEAYPLAKMLGLSNDDLARGTALFFALLLELIATFGYWCIFRATDPVPVRRPFESRTSITRPESILNVKPKLTLVRSTKAPAVTVDPAPILSRPDRIAELRRFLADCTQPAAGAAVRFDSIYGSYRQWCRANDVTPGGKNPLGQELQAMGYEPFRVGRRSDRAYRGVALKPRLVTGLRQAGSDSLPA